MHCAGSRFDTFCKRVALTVRRLPAKAHRRCIMIFTTYASAEVSAVYFRLKALAVFLQAATLLAVTTLVIAAFSFLNSAKSREKLRAKCVWIAVKCGVDSHLASGRISRVVAAIGAVTPLAKRARGKTLAI